MPLYGPMDCPFVIVGLEFLTQSFCDQDIWIAHREDQTGVGKSKNGQSIYALKNWKNACIVSAFSLY